MKYKSDNKTQNTKSKWQYECGNGIWITIKVTPFHCIWNLLEQRGWKEFFAVLSLIHHIYFFFIWLDNSRNNKIFINAYRFGLEMTTEMPFSARHTQESKWIPNEMCFQQKLTNNIQIWFQCQILNHKQRCNELSNAFEWISLIYTCEQYLNICIESEQCKWWYDIKKKIHISDTLISLRSLRGFFAFCVMIYSSRSIRLHSKGKIN